MKLTVTLFDSIINTSQDCVFWKDKNRRFIGVNRAFLDFYGFDSEAVLIGKTDEDMGWHNDPEPYRQDELRVLSGESTYKVPGKCMVQGEERDIIASKRPLYEGDEIVGLVGSFIDITDIVRRQKRLDSRQVMYTIDSLRKHDFWDRLLDNTPLDELLDPLCGVIKRNYMTDFAHFLIAKKIPFSLTLLDLDNFKLINDQYGHHSGDMVLKAVTKSLAEYTEGFGLVGRYGGDELLLIDMKNTDRERNKEFWDKLYASHTVFRRDIAVDNGSTFVTGTCGSASFPKDSENLSELFSEIDKALYLGKGRGRNCFVVYDPEKHSEVEIKKAVRRDRGSDMTYLRKVMDNAADPFEGISSVMPLIKDTLKINELYYIDEDGYLRAFSGSDIKEKAFDAEGSINEELYICHSAYDIEEDSPVFSASLKSLGISTFISAKLWKDPERTGYLICPSGRKHRIWQESDCAFVAFLAMLIGYRAG